MLRITEQSNAGTIVFKLAGALAGDWATELERCWRIAQGSTKASRIFIDLSDVTFIDEAGKELLKMMMNDGTELIARDILTKSILEELTIEPSAMRTQ